MKKKNIANLVMVLLIMAIAAFGVATAWNLRTDHASLFGSENQITEIQNNRLVSDDGTENLCTITILCETVFDNLEALDEAKIPYIPENGEILPATTVEFAEGETVFDVLNRVCGAADLQLEYSWTPLYNSYYVEGINHLYEFDCGVESGWMYRVNGWFPNYGCSAYELQPGDEIVWCYTCVGLGEDVGETRMGDT